MKLVIAIFTHCVTLNEEETNLTYLDNLGTAAKASGTTANNTNAFRCTTNVILMHNLGLRCFERERKICVLGSVIVLDILDSVCVLW